MKVFPSFYGNEKRKINWVQKYSINMTDIVPLEIVPRQKREAQESSSTIFNSHWRTFYQLKTGLYPYDKF